MDVMEIKCWWVYMIETQSGALYSGITTDLERRFRQHSGEIKGGAKYLRANPPLAIRYKKRFKSRSEASIFEAHLKSLSRSQKLKLCRSQNL